jgi:hypothetical protein
MIQTNPVLAKKFNALAAQWREETRFESSTTKIVSNPSYLKIISFGPDILPYIFHNLKTCGGHWFSALHIITGKTPPVSQKDIGNIPAITRAWLQWAVEHGYLDT